MIVSLRLRNPDPVLEAFTDLTYAWFDEMKLDFEACTGEAYLEGGGGVLMANDALIAIHGRDATWSRFDLDEFERWVRAQLPGFAALLPAMVAELACFTNYLARKGRVDPACAERAQERLEQVVAAMGIPAEPGPNRATRRSQRARSARMN